MISFHGHSFTKITCFQMINALHDTKCLNHIHDPMPFLLYTRLGKFKASDGPHRHSHTHNIASVRKLWQLNRVALLCIFSWAISTFTSDPVRLVRVVLINEDVTPMSMKYSPPPAAVYRMGLHNTADEILLRASGVARGQGGAMAFQTFAPRSVCGVSETNSATTPPPTECGCFLGITENVCYYPPPSHPHRTRLASGDHGQFLLLPPPHRTWSAAGAHGNVAPPNKNPGYAGAPSMYRGSGNQMKIVPSYIVHALVTSLYTTYIFRGFVKKVLPQ